MLQLTSNSQSSCFSFPCIGITGVHHHAWLKILFEFTLEGSKRNSYVKNIGLDNLQWPKRWKQQKLHLLNRLYKGTETWRKRHQNWNLGQIQEEEWSRAELKIQSHKSRKPKTGNESQMTKDREIKNSLYKEFYKWIKKETSALLGAGKRGKCIRNSLVNIKERFRGSQTAPWAEVGCLSPKSPPRLVFVTVGNYLAKPQFSEI